MITIDGVECKCGYKTISLKPICPRCGRNTVPRKFFDEGVVLSYVSLGVKPVDHDKPLDIAMVEIDNGPQVVCWTDEQLKIDQRIRVVVEDGIIRCRSP